jgi:hypothetical protein
MACTDKPSEVLAHERPPIPLRKECVSGIISAVSHIIMCRYHGLYALVSVENPFVCTLSVALPQDIAVGKKSGGVADYEGVFVVGDIVRTL